MKGLATLLAKVRRLAWRDPLGTRLRMERASAAALRRLGWEVSPVWNHGGNVHCNHMDHVASFFARKDAVQLLVGCRDTANPAGASAVADMAEYAVRLGMLSLLICAEEPSRRVAEIAAASRVVVLRLGELVALDAVIASLPHSVTGWLDRFVPPDAIEGWAKATGSGARVEVVVQLDGEEIGRATADRMREDLRTYGDGRFGFRVQLRAPFNPRDVRRIVVRALLDGRDIGRISPTKACNAQVEAVLAELAA